MDSKAVHLGPQFVIGMFISHRFFVKSPMVCGIPCSLLPESLFSVPYSRFMNSCFKKWQLFQIQIVKWISNPNLQNLHPVKPTHFHPFSHIFPDPTSPVSPKMSHGNCRLPGAEGKSFTSPGANIMGISWEPSTRDFMGFSWNVRKIMAWIFHGFSTVEHPQPLLCLVGLDFPMLISDGLKSQKVTGNLG